MKRAFWMLAALALLVGGLGQAKAGPIPVPNFSFETPAVSTFNAGPVTGWSGSGGVFNPAGTEAAFALPSNYYFNPGFPTDGVQSAYLNGGALTTTNPVATIQAGTTYTLLVDVGERNDISLPAYTIGLEANGVTVASFSGAPNSIGAGDWVTDTVTLPGSLASLYAGESLGITLSNDGGGVQVNFDNVRLDASNAAAVPEPSTLTLLGIGAVCSLCYGWRRRKLLTA